MFVFNRNLKTLRLLKSQKMRKMVISKPSPLSTAVHRWVEQQFRQKHLCPSLDPHFYHHRLPLDTTNPPAVDRGLPWGPPPPHHQRMNRHRPQAIDDYLLFLRRRRFFHASFYRIKKHISTNFELNKGIRICRVQIMFSVVRPVISLQFRLARARLLTGLLTGCGLVHAQVTMIIALVFHTFTFTDSVIRIRVVFCISINRSWSLWLWRSNPSMRSEGANCVGSSRSFDRWLSLVDQIVKGILVEVPLLPYYIENRF